MAIEYTDDSIFESDADAWVNPVNCVGVMGAGLAREFRDRFPTNYKEYRRACSAGEMSLGRMLVFHEGPLSKPEWIVNFPTKYHWREDSAVDAVASGLSDLSDVIRNTPLASVSMPYIGCGLGGLSWRNDVFPLVDRALSDSPARILVHRPPR